MADEPTLSNLSSETRSFPPSEEFAAQANATEEWYARGDDDREAFWAEQADRLHWHQKWDRGARLAAAVREVVRGRQAQRRLQLRRPPRRGRARRAGRVPLGGRARATPAPSPTPSSSARCARRRTRWPSWVSQTGDRVAIQLPMIPEAVVSMLACARLGAMHSVVFGGFSPSALKARIEDAECKLLITSDGQYRRGKPAPMKENTDEAVAQTPRRSSTCSSSSAPRPRCPWTEGRDVWWHDVVDKQSDEHEPRGLRRRAPAVHPLHLGHHREAEGHPAHLRRLPHPGGLHPPRGVRPQARRERLLVHRRHRLGHRAQLHRLRAAGQPRHVGDVRGHAEHPARGPALGDRRRSTASRSTTPRRRSSARS